MAAGDMLHAAYLTIGKLAPDYENVELSVGGSTVAAAVVEATGQSSLSQLNYLGHCLLHTWTVCSQLILVASVSPLLVADGKE